MNIDLNVNDLFINKEVMVDAFGVLAVRNNFEVRVSRSSNSRYNLICKVSNCPWKMNATVCRESKLWVIRTFVKTHNCYSHVSSATNRQCSSNLISKMVKQDFMGDQADSIKPKGVIDIMRTRFKVEISYFKAWKGRAEALTKIRGSFSQSYSHLPIVAEMIKETNPGNGNAINFGLFTHTFWFVLINFCLFFNVCRYFYEYRG